MAKENQHVFLASKPGSRFKRKINHYLTLQGFVHVTDMNVITYVVDKIIWCGWHHVQMVINGFPLEHILCVHVF